MLKGRFGDIVTGVLVGVAIGVFYTQPLTVHLPLLVIIAAILTLKLAVR